MTSISQQLKALKQGGETKNQDKLKASVLYSIKDAPSYDLDQIYYIAIQGIKKLVQIDSSFSEVQYTLLSPVSKGISRGTLSQSENEELDERVKALLLQISPYFLFEGALQVLEYLLRNFEIHKYTPIEVTVYFLQFHSSSVYTRLLQNFVDDHRKQNDILNFLYSTISKGEILTKQQVVRQIQADYRLLKHLIEYTQQVLSLKNSSRTQMKEYVYNVQGADQFALSQEQISVVKQRQPLQLSFLFSILSELNHKATQQYLEGLRGAFGKLVGLVLEEIHDESLSFVYLLIVKLYLFNCGNQSLNFQSGNVQWLSQAQINVVGKFLFEKIPELVNNQIYWEIINLLFKLKVNRTNEFCYFLIMEQIKIGTVQQVNQIVVLELLKYFLTQTKGTQKEYHQLLVQQLSNELQSTKQHFVESVLQELKQSSNKVLVELIMQGCKQLLSAHKAYTSYFPSEDIDHITLNSLEMFIQQNKQGVKYTVGQIISYVNDVQNLLIQGKGKTAQLLNLLQKLLNQGQQEYQHARFYDILKLNKLIQGLKGKVGDKIMVSLLEIGNQLFDDNIQTQLSFLLRLSVSGEVSFQDVLGNAVKRIKISFTEHDLIKNLNQYVNETLEVSDLNDVYNLELILNGIHHVSNSEISKEGIEQIYEQILPVTRSPQFMNIRPQLQQDFINGLFDKYINTQGQLSIGYLKLILSMRKYGFQLIKQELLKENVQLMIALMSICLSSKNFNDNVNFIPIIALFDNLLSIKDLSLVIQGYLNTFVVVLFFVIPTLNDGLGRVYGDLLSKFYQAYSNQTTLPWVEYESFGATELDVNQVNLTLFKYYKQKNQILGQSKQFLQFIQADVNRILQFVELGVLVIDTLILPLSSVTMDDVKEVFKLVLAQCQAVLQTLKNDSLLQTILQQLEIQLDKGTSQSYLFLETYICILAKVEQPDYDRVIGYLTNVQDVNYIGQDLNNLVISDHLSKYPSQMVSEVILKLSKCQLESKNIYIGAFDVKPVINEVITLLKDVSVNFETFQYLIQTLKSNIELVKKNKKNNIIQLLSSTSTQLPMISIIQELISEYIGMKSNIKFPLETSIGNQLQSFSQLVNNDFTELYNYHIFSQMFKNLSILISKMKKNAAFQITIDFFQSQLTQEIQPTNALVLIQVIVQSFNNYANVFFHKDKYPYYLSALLLSMQSYVTESKSESQLNLSHLNNFHSNEFWILIYLACKYQLDEGLKVMLRENLCRQETKIKFGWMQNLTDCLVHQQIGQIQKEQKKKPNKKVVRRRKYVSNQFQKILRQVDNGVNMIIKLYNPCKKLIQISFKRQIIQTLVFLDTLIESLKLGEYQLTQEDRDNITLTIKSMYQLVKWNLGSKLSNLIEKKKNQMLCLLDLDTIFQITEQYQEDKMVYRVFLEGLDKLLYSNKLKFKKGSFNRAVQFLSSLSTKLNTQVKAHIITAQLSILAYLCKNKVFLDILYHQHEQVGKNIIEQLFLLLETDSLYLRLKVMILKIFSLVANIERYPFVPIMRPIFKITLQLLMLTLSKENTAYEQSPMGETLALLVGIEELSANEIPANIEDLGNCLELMIQAFGPMISKKDLLKILLFVLATKQVKCEEMIVAQVEKRILISIIPDLIDSCLKLGYQGVINLAQFLSVLIKQSESESVQLIYLGLTQNVVQLLDYPKHKFIDNEIEGSIFIIDQVENAVIDVYLQLVVKLNDLQLKKSFNQLMQWAKQKPTQSGYNYREYNKLTFFKIVFKLSNLLGSLFTKYFNYIFDSLITFFNDFHQIFTQVVKKSCNICICQQCFVRIEEKSPGGCRHALQCVEQMCLNDKDEFFDTERFEKLALPLSLVLDCSRVNEFESLREFILEWAQSTIIQVFQHVNDDFKWKTLHYNILQILQKHSTKVSLESVEICISIVLILEQLILKLEDRYIVLINDLVPYLYNLAQMQASSEELDKLVKQVIIKLNQISGEDVGKFLKSTIKTR